MVRGCSTHREKGNAYRVLVGKFEGKRPPERSIHTWENNIITDLRETEWWRGLADLAAVEDRYRAFVNTLMNIRILQNTENFLCG
jgi:hypothetical protein